MMEDSERKILIIDDSVTNTVLLSAILSARGYQTETALSAAEALEKIESCKPDLILLDLLMPEISGFDFLERIKSQEETKDIPVIVVSALTDAKTVSRTKEMGAAGYIKKPVGMKILLECVYKTIG